MNATQGNTAVATTARNQGSPKAQPISPEHRVRVRTELSAPIMARFHAWLEALAPQVLPQSLLGKAVHYTLGLRVKRECRARGSFFGGVSSR